MGKLRQVVVVAADLKDAEDKFTKHLDTFVTFRDPELEYFGMHNALLPVGRSFLEIVSPLPGQEESSAGGRFLQRRGPGGYMLIVQVSPTTLEHARKRADDLNLRVVHEGSRTQEMESQSFSLGKGPGFDEDGISGFHLHPKDVGCITEIATQRPANKWTWAGNEWLKPESRMQIGMSPTRGFAGATIATPDPQKTAKVWADLLQLEPERIENMPSGTPGECKLHLDDDSFLHFRQPQNPDESGVVSIHVVTETSKHEQPGSFDLAGTDLHFHHPLKSKL
mmetsp:Transcript_10587/g.20834  ORF Transcript_10587/g.20834 Transcript_10587/m.20834 type:complete len:280 (+) Transcript_10587:187-1026(+)|eukprot:CAMPEP_0171554870 /NCGR_PEP_ID=MMETSP0960-20121227/9780_1 /TAXON_ID=87120 /ORGANISM="Aurantiochytrium limacinum, Strain ATCCMYA-1381" /LENGTH=279 /DNA_ID=CAMNT_0012104805 /DNA_START=99 /DNA_END=938 /DNA_ORIENTATION=+